MGWTRSMKRNRRPAWMGPEEAIRALACAWMLAMPVAHADNGRPPVPVVVTEAREQAVRREVSVAGSVVARRSALLSATVAGRVESLHVDDGAAVAGNDVLLELDARLARQEVAAARAATHVSQTDVPVVARKSTPKM